MKITILILDIICIILVLYLTIDIIIYTKKSEGKKVEEVNKYLAPRIKYLKLLTIVLCILGIIISIYNAIK